MHQKVTLWLRDSCYNKETVEQAVIIHRRCKPKYEPDEIILLCNYLHCYSGHGGTWAAAVADSIKKVYSSIDYCYRIAGDEFCVILKRGKMDVLSNSKEEYFIPEKDELMYQKKWLRKQGKR